MLSAEIQNGTPRPFPLACSVTEVAEHWALMSTALTREEARIVKSTA